jgi:hypothetical protein
MAQLDEELKTRSNWQQRWAEDEYGGVGGGNGPQSKIGKREKIQGTFREIGKEGSEESKGTGSVHRQKEIWEEENGQNVRCGQTEKSCGAEENDDA